MVSDGVVDYHDRRETIDDETLASASSGAVLREAFMEPHGLGAGAVAKACHVPRTRIERIVAERTGITTDTALCLEKLFGASAAFWLGLQAEYDMATTRAAIETGIATIAPVAA